MSLTFCYRLKTQLRLQGRGFSPTELLSNWSPVANYKLTISSPCVTGSGASDMEVSTSTALGRDLGAMMCVCVWLNLCASFEAN